MFCIDHDLHLHSTLSKCCHDPAMTPEKILAWAEKQGYRTLCLTNHLWDGDVPGASAWYASQDIPHLREALPLPQGENLRFCFGCEAEYCGGDKLSLRPEHFDGFDFVAIAVNHMHMKGLTRPEDVDTAEKMAELFTSRMEQLLKLPFTFRKVGLAHLNIHHMFREGTAADVLRLCDKERWSAIFRDAAEKGIGIELNASAFAKAGENMAVHLDFFRLAKKAGCRFYCASDAHKLDALEISSLRPVIDALGLTEQDRYVIL